MSQYSYNQGRKDAQSGKGPASQQKQPYQSREKYDAGYSQQKQGGKK